MNKLLRYWWNYNLKSKEPSALFYVAFILLTPFIFIWFLCHIVSVMIDEWRIKRKKFWEGYRSYKKEVE